MSELMKMPLKINCSIVQSWFSKRHYLHELRSKPWIPRSTSLPVQNSFFPSVPKRKETKEKKKNSVDNTVVWLEMKRLLNKLEALGTEIRIE